MRFFNSHVKTGMLILFGSAFLISCASLSSPATAQSGTGIRVLVMGEDSDPRSVIRSSDIFKRVLAELKGSMQRQGFRMVDEEMIAVTLGWRITTRRPKTELIQAGQMANASGTAANSVRALATFSIHAFKEDLGFTNKVSTRIDGEMYDVLTNQFLGTFELPRAQYPAPADCNDACISEVVGDKAREIATSLGEILGKKLAYLAPPPGASGSTGGAPVGSGIASTGHGMMSTYTLEMQHFDARETAEIIGVMSSEFPGYSSHNVLEQTSAVRKYEYVTTATAAKLHEWLTVLLIDMGLNPDREVEIVQNGNHLRLYKIVVPNRSNIPVSQPRFR